MTVRKLMKILNEIEQLQRQMDAIAAKEPDRDDYISQQIYNDDLDKWELRRAACQAALNKILDQEFT